MHDPEVPTIEMMRPLYFVEGAYGGPSIASGPIGPAHKRRYDLLEMKRKTREHNQNIGAPSHLQLTPCNKCKKQRKTQ